MDLLFDTETTGLPSKGADITHSDFPHIVQIACAHRERSSGRILSAAKWLLFPEHPFIISPEATKVHGIDKNLVDLCGIKASRGLAMFRIMANLCERIVAFNMPFDWSLISALAYRSNIGVESLPKLPRFCAMEAAKPLCAIPPTERMIKAGFGSQFKSPSLQEAYRLLVDPVGFDGAHDAFADLVAMNKVLNKLEQTVQDTTAKTAP